MQSNHSFPSANNTLLVTSEEHRKFVEEVQRYIDELQTEPEPELQASVGKDLTAFLNSLHTRGWNLKDLVYGLMRRNLHYQQANEQLKTIWDAYKIKSRALAAQRDVRRAARAKKTPAQAIPGTYHHYHAPPSNNLPSYGRYVNASTSGGDAQYPESFQNEGGHNSYTSSFYSRAASSPGDIFMYQGSGGHGHPGPAPSVSAVAGVDPRSYRPPVVPSTAQRNSQGSTSSTLQFYQGVYDHGVHQPQYPANYDASRH